MYGVYSGSEMLARFVAPMSLHSNHPVEVADSLSLRRSIRRSSSQRWEISTRLMPLTTNSNRLFAEFASKGSAGTYSIIVPQNYGAVFNRKPLGTLHRCNATVDATSVNIETTSFIPAGTMVKFANHSKVYMTTTDRNGTGVMGIYPPLRTTLVNQNMLWRDDVPMNVRLDTDAIGGMTFTDGIVMDNGVLKLLEIL